MYEFATVTLLGLALAQIVELVGRLRSFERPTRLFAGITLGVATAWALDYSLLAGWGIQVREAWMGLVATGLIIAGMASVWRSVLGTLGARGEDEATPHRIQRAA